MAHKKSQLPSESGMYWFRTPLCNSWFPCWVYATGKIVVLEDTRVRAMKSREMKHAEFSRAVPPSMRTTNISIK